MRILIVDDQELNRALLQFMLEDDGYQVFCAENGRIALEMFEDAAPDVILLDVMMPELDGYQTAPLLKQRAAQIHLPIIFITALDDQESLLKCLEVGGDDFLTKPFDKVVLSAKIRAHCRTRQLSLKIYEQNQLLEAHQNQFERDHHIVDHIFSNALQENHFDRSIIDFSLSPASMFNGDLLLVGESPLGHTVVFMGDFTGHGLAAAVGALPVSKTFFSMVKKGLAVGDLAAEINRQLQQLLPDDMFCAAFIIELGGSGKSLSVWAGGLPDAYVVCGKSGQIKHRISSSHMALGILDEYEFDRDVQNYDVSVGDKVCLMTDGVIEATNTTGEMFGESNFEQLLSYPQLSVDFIINQVQVFCAGAVQHDDLSFAMISCQPNQGYNPQHQTCSLLPQQCRLTLSAEHMKRSDPVLEALNLVCNIKGLSDHRSSLFLILSELYNNALEHGLLGLDSKIKDDTEEGFLTYYSLRQERLDELIEGQIILDLCFHPNSQMLEIGVEDSGPGFIDETTQVESDQSFGRGIFLVSELVEKIEYLGKGNHVKVYYNVA